jgi:hypothetical protein
MNNGRVIVVTSMTMRWICIYCNSSSLCKSASDHLVYQLLSCNTKWSPYFQVIIIMVPLNQKQNLRYLILLYDYMMHVPEPQGPKLDPKFFSKSHPVFIDTLGEVRWTETHYPLLHHMLVRLMIMREVV